MKRLLLCVLLLASPVLAQEQGRTIHIDSWSGPHIAERLGTWDQAIECINFEFEQVGNRFILKTRGGSDTLSAGGMGASEIARKAMFYTPDGAAERLFVTTSASGGSSGAVYATNGAAWNNVTTDNGGDNWVDGTSADLLVFKDTLIVTGGDVDSIYQISPTEAVTQWPWFYPQMCLHQDRVWAAGVEDSVRSKVVYRPLFDIDFDSMDTKFNSGYVYVNKDDGDAITEIMPLGNDVIVYKSRNIYRVITSSVTGKPTDVIHAVSGLGAWGYNAVASAGNRHYFMNYNGVYEFDGVTATRISGPIDSWLEDSLGSPLAYTTGIAALMVDQGTLFIAGQFADDRVFTYDIETGAWTHNRFEDVYTMSGTPIIAVYRSSPEASAFNLTGILGLSRHKGVPFFGFNFPTNNNFFAFPTSTSADADTFNIAPTFTSAFMGLGPPLSRYSVDAIAITINAGTLAGDTVFIDWLIDARLDNVIATDTIALAANMYTYYKRVRRTVTGSSIAYRIRADESDDLEIHGFSARLRERGGADYRE